MITYTMRVEVTMECDGCGIAREVAAGLNEKEIPALSAGLHSLKTWTQIGDKDVCAKCSEIHKKIVGDSNVHASLR